MVKKGSDACKAKGDIGLIGLAVMGENLILNMANHGFTVCCYNRTTSKVDEFLEGRAKGKTIIGCYSIEEMVANLAKPARVQLMVKAGEVVDQFIEQVIPHLSAGDIIIDGGNSNWNDTDRRIAYLKEKGILFLGTGVSGGEEGALTGPSIMPGGRTEAWPHVREIFQSICAKEAKSGAPCCDWVGDGGSGHYTKMVHNGIEYGDMQLCAEAYFLLKHIGRFDNQKVHECFTKWRTGDLDSFLIDITADIFAFKGEGPSGQEHLVDYILDAAGQKGTGKWTSMNAADLGVPLTLVSEAVFARCVSSLVDERREASQILAGPADIPPAPATLEQDIRDALLASKIISYAQGFMLLKQAAVEYKWNLQYGNIALMWRGGCIIRSVFLGNIKEAYDKNPNLANLMLDPWFTNKLRECSAGWRRVVALGALSGVPTPCFSSALSFYDGYRSARTSANLIQAQRDYFGAHTYERVDKPRHQMSHTNWTGRGGTTASSSYNA